MSKWKILHGAGDVAVYNGLKKIFHVFPEEAKIVCDILNRLEDELARCKAERLKVSDEEAAREMLAFLDYAKENGYKHNDFGWYKVDDIPSVSVAMNYGVGLTYISTMGLIQQFRASQPKTNEG